MTSKKVSVLPGRKNLLHVAIATTLSMTAMMGYAAQAPQDEEEDDDELEEVVVTGSRIVRRDMETNSPLLTIEMQQFEDSAFISVEEALNELPQFMVGGAGMNAGAVTSLQGANGMDGGRGTGDMFNMSLLPDNAGMIGIVVPGAANVNLRGLGANRALTLIDGHRAMPINASMTVDLNTIPNIAIGGMEVITGGASAVYGADALAGVTNIKFRDNYEGLTVRVRGGQNEVGDGREYQVATLFGSDVADGRAHVLVGVEYSKRETTLWNERDFFKEVMESPYSNSGDYAFAWEPYYSSNGSLTAGGVPNRLQTSGAPAGNFSWSGNAPSTAAILSVFSDRNCRDATGALVNCIANTTNAPFGGGWGFNPDGTIFLRSSQATVNGVVNYFGPQSYLGNTTATTENPNEVTCTYVAPTSGVQGLAASTTPFGGKPCNPTLNRVDWERWLASPRDAYTFFGRATYDVTDSIQAFANFHFASSSTMTRREPAPFLGGFGVVIPFHTTQGGDAVYLPSVITTPAAGQVTGQTRPEFLAGGARGTSCPAMGGCLMSQAFPVSAELRTLLESRPQTALIGTTGANATNPFRGLSDCNLYKLANNLPAGTPGVLTNPNGGARYIVETDPYTGQPYSKCGPNSGWQLNQQLPYLPPRGTDNTGELFQIAYGLRGDLGIKDWTWELYGSSGVSETATKYIGFSSLNTFQRILSAPNYGQGYQETGTSSKYLTCTSGLSPFKPNLKVSQDCIDALLTNQIDRNTMSQRIFELSTQGGLFNVPAGEVRGSAGAQYRRNSYKYTPDSTRERDYITDTSAGQFASGMIDESVDVNEVFGELLIPLLNDMPFINSLELELGARYSDYSTGQEVDTYKVMGSWEPLDWLRVRGGYNRAERAPNMSELFATPSASAQFSAAPTDPCRNFQNPASSNTTFFPGPTPGSSLNNSPTTDAATRAKLQALCSAQINQWGGNNSSTFHGDPNNFDLGGGGALIVGNPNLRNEQGDTWTLGAAFSSPFEHPLLSSISGTIDWYKARVTDPIETVSTGTIVNTCYNINGLNPSYTLDDPFGFCSLIERDPGEGNIVRVYNSFDNLGELEISGLDVAVRWNAAMEDIGLDSIPGTISISTNFNYLIDQIQRYGAAALEDYTGFGGAAEFRANTGFTYAVDRYRATLTWTYRTSTDSPTTFATTANAEGSTSPTLQPNRLITGYDAAHTFNLTLATTIGEAVNLSFSVSNLLDTEPEPGGYDIRDPLQGFGNFSPFDDLVGRRYSFNLTTEF
jgi:iron complex outermembrane recepter protein